MSAEHSPAAVGEAPDYDEIVGVVLRYVDAWKDGDIQEWRECFHEDCWIFCTSADGSLEHEPISGQFDYWSGDTPLEVVGRIISVTQAGDIASVLLGFDYAPDLSNGWVDLHALLRIDGRWWITNKTATHCSMAGWAAPTVAD
jgi:hypothetical protein